MTETSKYVIAVSGILITSSLATGLWFVSNPSAKGNTHMPIAVVSLSPPTPLSLSNAQDLPRHILGVYPHRP